MLVHSHRPRGNIVRLRHRSSTLSAFILAGALATSGCRGDAPAPSAPAPEDAQLAEPAPPAPETDTAEAAPSVDRPGDDAGPAEVPDTATAQAAPATGLAALRLDADVVRPAPGEPLAVPTRAVDLDGVRYDVGQGARVEAFVAAQGEAALVVWRGVAEAGYVEPPRDYTDWGTHVVGGRVPTHNESPGWDAYLPARLELVRLRREGDAWVPVGAPAALGFRWGSRPLAPRASVDLVPGQWAVVGWWTVECGSGTSTCHPYRDGQAVRLTAGGLGAPVPFPGAERVPAYGEDLCQLNTFGYLGSFADLDGDGALDLRVRATAFMAGCDANAADCLLTGRVRLPEPGIPLHYLARGDAFERVEKTVADLVESALVDPSPALVDQAIAVVDYAARTDGSPTPALAAKHPAVFATLCAVDTMEGPKGGRAAVPALVARLRAAAPLSAEQTAALAGLEAALAVDGADPE